MLKIKEKIPIAILIGGGSKLPAIIRASYQKSSQFYISLVVSHKKNSPGIDIAIKNNIPAVYFNLVDWKNRLKKSRIDYMSKLAWFITQNPYRPKLLVFAGWDLIMDKNFFDYFKANTGNGYCAINLHPGLMRLKDEKQIQLPDGSNTPVIKGEQQEVLETVINKKLTYFGPSVHFMVATNFDEGKVIQREFIKVGNTKTVDILRKKLMPAEDRILIEAIDEVIGEMS